MAESNISSSPRSFGRVDAKRVLITLAMLAIVGVVYWFMLPAIQLLIIPNAPGGNSGPWVVRPILASHFGAVAVMAAVTFPLLARPLRRLWKREDGALGTQYDPFHGRPMKRARLLVAGFLVLAVYASGLVFYLFSWTIIGPDGIELRLPWTTLNHSFQDIVTLERIPEGERSESIRQNGPWYSIKLKSGRSITLSGENEGITSDELRAMAAYMADRSGRTWVRRSDARAH